MSNIQGSEYFVMLDMFFELQKELVIFRIIFGFFEVFSCEILYYIYILPVGDQVKMSLVALDLS